MSHNLNHRVLLPGLPIVNVCLSAWVTTSAITAIESFTVIKSEHRTKLFNHRDKPCACKACNYKYSYFLLIWSVLYTSGFDWSKWLIWVGNFIWTWSIWTETSPEQRTVDSVRTQSSCFPSPPRLFFLKTWHFGGGFNTGFRACCKINIQVVLRIR